MKPKTRMAGIRATAGARAKTHLSAASGMIESFWTNLIPSRTSWSTPWNGPGSLAPHPPVGRQRDDRLLLDELDPGGHQLEHAVEAAGLHRPDPGLHVGHDLVLD